MIGQSYHVALWILHFQMSVLVVNEISLFCIFVIKSNVRFGLELVKERRTNVNYLIIFYFCRGFINVEKTTSRGWTS